MHSLAFSCCHKQLLHHNWCALKQQKNRVLLDFLQVAKDVQIDEGSSKVSGTVYFAGEELRELLGRAYVAFSHTNPLHGDVFPSVRRMEAEVVAMVAAMLGGEHCSCSTAISFASGSANLHCSCIMQSLLVH